MADDSLSDKDKALFRSMMKDVKPLQKNNKVHFSPAKPNPEMAKRKAHLPPTETLPALFLSDYYATEVQSDSTLCYCEHSIPNKRLQELKRGKIPWQAKLDLHGLKPDAAKAVLQQFIMQQNALNHRSLLIIHGKGSHQGEAPILKNLVNRWLPQFPHVLAFHSALARDGGTGALYVLLKRLKMVTE